MVKIKNGYESNTSFLDIVPREKTYLEYSINSVPLEVLTSQGVTYTPDIDIKVTNLSKGQKHLLNLSGDGDKFKINVIIKNDDTITGAKGITEYYYRGELLRYAHSVQKFRVIDVLDYWIRNMTVLMVHTRAVDIPDGEYIITENSNRKQTFEDYTIWELEFTKYTGVYMLKYNFDNTKANKAISDYNASKKKTTSTTKKETVKKAETTASKLKKCNVNVMKYSKTKKIVACVKYMQEILKKKGFYTGVVDGWFGPLTTTAVKKFQQKYKTKYKLSVNGKVDKKTLDAICKV